MARKRLLRIEQLPFYVGRRLSRDLAACLQTANSRRKIIQTVANDPKIDFDSPHKDSLLTCDSLEISRQSVTVNRDRSQHKFYRETAELYATSRILSSLGEVILTQQRESVRSAEVEQVRVVSHGMPVRHMTQTDNFGSIL